jgi:hypothetical protein
MRQLLSHVTPAAALAVALLLGTPEAQAQSFSFQGLLADGPLAGQSFSGSFSVNAGALPPGADGEFPLLSFSMLLGSQTYTLASADGTPKAVYAAGSFAGLAYLDADAPDPGVRPWIAFIPGFDSFNTAYLAYTAAAVAGIDSGFGSYAVTVVPEPASLVLLLVGLGVVGASAARRPEPS